MTKLVFGDADARVWGAAWQGLVCIGAGGAAEQREARLEGGDQAREWRLLGEGVELSATAVADAVVGHDGFDQLCRMTGQFELGGTTHAVHSLGRRGAHGDLGTFDSVRDVSAWFEPDGGVALVAVRPMGARGQDTDLIAAAVLDVEGPAPVADPRLSTTYTDAGSPSRAGLELWLTDAENEFPLRAAGEALGVSVEASDGELQLSAELFRWHSRGRDGAGVYLLARRR